MGTITFKGIATSQFRFNEKNGCLKTSSKYGILVRNKGLFTLVGFLVALASPDTSSQKVQ